MLEFECGCRIDINSFTVYDIKLDCPATWKLISEGNTIGIFQIETPLGKAWSKRVKPDNLEILSALLSLLRPGVLKAVSGDPPKSMTKRYVDRRKGEEPISYFDVPELEQIFKDTYGVMVYQEQAMAIAQKIAGFNLKEADLLRKATGKKLADLMAKVEKEFINGCLKIKVVSEEKAKEIFSWIKESQRYLFNKSHAITYAKNSYWSAYLKAHFPVQFYCSWLDGAKWKQKKFEEMEILVNDAEDNEVKIRLPYFPDLQEEFYIKNDEVFFGLSSIRNVGESCIKKIHERVPDVEEKINKKVDEWTWKDFVIYFSHYITSRNIEALINSGALDHYELSRKRMVYEFGKWNELTNKEKDFIRTKLQDDYTNIEEALHLCAPAKKDGGGCANKNRTAIVNGLVIGLKNPPNKLDDSPDYIDWIERHYLGVPLTTSTIEASQEKHRATATLKEVMQKCLPYAVVAAEIRNIKMHTIKKGPSAGQKMAFVTLKDHSCTISAPCFTSQLHLYKDLLVEDNTVLVRLERKDSKPPIIGRIEQI
jgi:DNA polymerase III alpha subunit